MLHDIKIGCLFQYKSFLLICCFQISLYGLYRDYLGLGVIDITFVFNERMITYAKRKIWINLCRCYPDYQYFFRLVPS